MGSAGWQITGAGKGFSNVWDANAGHVSIVLEGYNYEVLFRYAQELKMLSKRIPRITNQAISSSLPGPCTDRRSVAAGHGASVTRIAGQIAALRSLSARWQGKV